MTKDTSVIKLVLKGERLADVELAESSDFEVAVSSSVSIEGHLFLSNLLVET